MILPRPPLEVFGIYDRGIPNSERIVLHANEPVNLLAYALILGLQAQDETIIPLADQFLWLGKTFLQSPSWVFVYTGDGTQGVSQETHTKQPIHVLYWGKHTTLLQDARIVPALMRFDYLELGNKPNRDISELMAASSANKGLDWEQLVKQLSDLASGKSR